MLAPVTTVHAVPKFALTRNASIKATTVVCRSCSQVLGSATDSVVRKFLQNSHNCADKRSGIKPTVAVPFN